MGRRNDSDSRQLSLLRRIQTLRRNRFDAGPRVHMTIQRSSPLAISIALAAVAGAAVAAGDNDDDGQPEKKHPFAVKFADKAGRPVAGALAGVTAYFGSEGKSLPAIDENGWRYLFDAKADADGIASFPDGADYHHLCIVARHGGRKLIAIERIDPIRFDPEDSRTPPTVTMQSECRVSGRLTCSDLAKRNRAAGWTNVYLNL